MNSAFNYLRVKKPFLFAVTVSLIIITYILPIAAYAVGEISTTSAVTEQIDRIIGEEISNMKYLPICFITVRILLSYYIALILCQTAV